MEMEMDGSCWYLGWRQFTLKDVDCEKLLAYGSDWEVVARCVNLEIRGGGVRANKLVCPRFDPKIRLFAVLYEQVHVFQLFQ